MRFLAELHFIVCLKTGFQSSLLSSPSVEELFLTIHFTYLCVSSYKVGVESEIVTFAASTYMYLLNLKTMNGNNVKH